MVDDKDDPAADDTSGSPDFIVGSRLSCRRGSGSGRFPGWGTAAPASQPLPPLLPPPPHVPPPPLPPPADSDYTRWISDRRVGIRGSRREDSRHGSPPSPRQPTVAAIAVDDAATAPAIATVASGRSRRPGPTTATATATPAATTTAATDATG